MATYMIEVREQNSSSLVDSIEFEEQIQQYAKCSVFDRLKNLEGLPDGRYYSILKREKGGQYQEVEGMPSVEICKDNNAITLLPETLPFC